MTTKKVSIPYQLVIRSENRLNYASTNPNDFQIYINEFLPSDATMFKVKLVQAGISKKALSSDTVNASRLNCNYIEVNVQFNSTYGYDTLYQGLNRYTHLIPPYENCSYVDIFSAPTIVCNKFDQNFLNIQIYGILNSANPPTRTLLTHVDGTVIRNCILIFEITPIYNDNVE